MLNEEYQKIFERVDAAYEAMDGISTEEHLKSIRNEVGETYGKDSTIYAAMCSELGGFYRGQGHFNASVEAFLEALAVLEKSAGMESGDYITTLNNLAGTYRMMRNFDAAEQLFLTCLDGYEKSIGTANVLYAAVLNNYALVCLDKGELNQCGQLLTRSSEILALLPECREEYASALCNSGVLFLNMQQFEIAEQMLRESIALYENELGTETPHYHAAWNALGAVYYRQDAYAAAEECFRRGHAAATAIYGPEHPETQALEQSMALMRQLQK